MVGYRASPRVAVIALVLLPPAREFAALLFPLAMSMPLLSRMRSFIDRHRAPAGGQSSTVTTAFLRMSLDHDTGSMSGTVLRGQFAGLRVEELGVGDLLALLRECRAEDEEGARLLEAYLDRLHPDWRDELAGGRGSGAGAKGGGTRPASGDISVEEAYAILGLKPGATRERDQGGPSPADGQIAPRPRRLGLSGDQDQPRPRRAAPRPIGLETCDLHGVV